MKIVDSNLFIFVVHLVLSYFFICDLMLNFQNSIDDELNEHSTNHSTSNDFNSKIILNTAYYNKYKPSLSKLNASSSNMMNVDKTITGFSIQMVSIYVIFSK